jgi:hypothetical protein
MYAWQGHQNTLVVNRWNAYWQVMAMGGSKIEPKEMYRLWVDGVGVVVDLEKLKRLQEQANKNWI